MDIGSDNSGLAKNIYLLGKESFERIGLVSSSIIADELPRSMRVKSHYWYFF